MSLLSWVTAPCLIWVLHIATRGATSVSTISGLASSAARLWAAASRVERQPRLGCVLTMYSLGEVTFTVTFLSPWMAGF